MKKILVILTILLLLPFSVLAKEKEYKSLTFDEALTLDGIEHDLSEYKETDKQATIYVFWGKGCPHCHNLLNFLYEIVPEYGQYFKIVSYETWNNADNRDLLIEVSEYMKKPTRGGVPFLIVGKKVFYGYNEKMNDEIKAAIKEYYNTEDRYDVFEKMHTEGKDYTPEIVKATIVVCAVTILASVGVVFYTYRSNKIIMAKLNKLESTTDVLKKLSKPKKEKSE